MNPVQNTASRFYLKYMYLRTARDKCMSVHVYTYMYVCTNFYLHINRIMLDCSKLLINPQRISVLF